MSKDPTELLRHILDESTYLISVTQHLSFDEFVEDETLKRAVVRSLEIIGEATKKFQRTARSNGIPFNGKTWLG
jgi:uncharacterized protein with HEPN domain